jgi:hypothetical protein
MFSEPQNDHEFTTFLPAGNHDFSIQLPRKTPIFRKTPTQNTPMKNMFAKPGLIDPNPRNTVHSLSLAL